MKLYKDGHVMKACEKDQLDICLNAGWSRTKPVEEEEKSVKDENLTDGPGTDETDVTAGTDEPDVIVDDTVDDTAGTDEPDVDVPVTTGAVIPESKPAATPKKITKPKVLKKKK